jgi:quinoprotein glucose dehydrogenase
VLSIHSLVELVCLWNAETLDEFRYPTIEPSLSTGYQLTMTANQFTRRALQLLIATVLLNFVSVSVCSGQEILPDGSQAARERIQGFRFPDDMEMKLFAAEPQLASPVAICLDEKGRVFVVEEYRFNRGTEENRTRPFLLNDDLQIQSLEDRLATFKKYKDQFDGGMKWFTKVSDQVRLLEDKDGDGRADSSKIFAGGFNDVLDGLAAGVIARDGDVYVTCIPHLWRLRDKDGDGVAEIREPLLRGFGVNCGFLGHDLHGLAWGPDGRLYFSVGDRGFNVQTQEGHRVAAPRRGAVFRCDPDGSHLEVVHVGLRNPQEIAFDEFGNLFAADNNCDKGDLSRLVYVVEGGDSGWNMAYQTIPDPYLTGPWHAENMWHVEATGKPAWVLPPVGALGAGPSGFSYYPGVGLDKRYDGHFFLCNYTGNGGIETFAVKPHGAAFRIIDEKDFLKPISATDLEFGYDGKVYVSDFVGLDWSGKSKGGRIYTLTNRDQNERAAADKVRQLFANGFRSLNNDQLFELLRNRDMRVRQRVQFEIVRRDDSTVRLLKLASDINASSRARRHAVWALWQLGRKQESAVAGLRQLLNQSDHDVQEQTLRALGDLRDAGSLKAMADRLGHENPRIRFHATMGIARINAGEHVEPTVNRVAQMLSENKNQDPYLSHAGVMAITNLLRQSKQRHDLSVKLAQSPSQSVRLAAVLVTRRLSDSKTQEMTRFLHDKNIDIVTEAARAINGARSNDVVAERALSDVADRFPSMKELPDALVRRVILASFRQGNAERLLSIIVNEKLSASMKQEAIESLKLWVSGTNRDRVNGNWRPVAGRDPSTIKKLLAGGWDRRLLKETNGEILIESIKLLAQFDVPLDEAKVVAWANDEARSVSTRAACLKFLASRKSNQIANVVAGFIKSDSPELRSLGRSQLAKRDPKAAIASIRDLLKSQSNAPSEIQSAIGVLSQLASEPADSLLGDLFEQVLESGALVSTQNADTSHAPVSQAAMIAFDIVEAAKSRRSNLQLKVLLDLLQAVQEKQRKSDPLVAFSSTLWGGDRAAGERVFRGHRKAQCIRCHKVRGDGGAAGPDLTQLSKKPNRRHILESIVTPNAKIAKGFGITTILTNKGRIISGTSKSETDKSIVLETSQGKTQEILITDIDERKNSGVSAMPQMTGILSNREIRDLIEFLASSN